MDDATTVLLVEDHASYRQALQTLLEADGEFRVVAQAGTAGEAGPAAARTVADLALVDLDLAGGSGVDALAGIRAASPATTCVVLSALHDEAAFGRAIAAGAAGVLHKSIEVAELLHALRAVVAGTSILPSQDATRWLRAWDRRREQGRHAQAIAQRLTSREREILALLADGGSHVEIGRQLDIAPDTVQTHIRNLLAKLAVHSRLEAVIKAMRLGLVGPPR